MNTSSRKIGLAFVHLSISGTSMEPDYPPNFGYELPGIQNARNSPSLDRGCFFLSAPKLVLVVGLARKRRRCSPRREQRDGRKSLRSCAGLRKSSFPSVQLHEIVAVAATHLEGGAAALANRDWSVALAAAAAHRGVRPDCVSGRDRERRHGPGIAPAGSRDGCRVRLIWSCAASATNAAG
jgi:hypothetical protein